MSWLERWARDREVLRTSSAFQHETLDTHLEMTGALTFAVEVRNRQRRFIEHCTRVTRLVDRLAVEFHVDTDDYRALRYAAQLHELGMIAVPSELLERPAPLTRDELEQVRAQARIGAEIVRATHDPRTARLIENQYTDFDELRERVPDGSRELLLAGILRVADVFDTLCHPRPYQRDITETHRTEVLRSGAGTRFHPSAVDVLFQVRQQLGEVNA